MTEAKMPVTEDELHAYVDNELPAERREDVEAWLSAHPDDAERVQAWRAMAEALHARYDGVADEPIPKRLEIEQLTQRPRRWIMGAIAASLLAFVAGSGVGWLAHGAAATPSTFQSFTVDALDAYRLYVVEVRHPVEVPGSERDHLQQWLTKRCGWDVHAPQLDATGLKLVGGRLFRTEMTFPANVPTGIYTAEVYLVKDGEIVSAQTTPLIITKTGVGAEIFDIALHHSALYGLCAVALAMAAGWIAAMAFRRG